MHLRKIEPSVQCGHERPAEPPQQRNVESVQMAVNDVEFILARATHSSKAVSADIGSIGGRLNRSGLGDIATSSVFVFEPPLQTA
jgi:hypothetical protein